MSAEVTMNATLDERVTAFVHELRWADLPEGAQPAAGRSTLDLLAALTAGAALANGMAIDAMDGHDGHRLVEDHAGAGVFPAALVEERLGLSCRW